MKITKVGAVAAGLTFIATGVAVSSAVATPQIGTVGPVPSRPVLLSTLDGPAKASQDDVRLKTDEDMTVRTFDLRYAPGSASGWHKHPGIVLAVVAEGSVVRQVGCTSETFVVGQAFTEVAPHHVSNPGTTDAVLRITQIFPADTDLAELRQDRRAPDCSGDHDGD